MSMVAYLPSLIGGGLIGLSAGVLMLSTGRVAGISGIVSGLWRRAAPRLLNLAFVLGLAVGPWAYWAAFGQLPEVKIEASTPALAIAGLLVGLGTRLGSGCTSGHGVVGLARLSPRSLAAVATFLTTAMATVAVLRLAASS